MCTCRCFFLLCFFFFLYTSKDICLKGFGINRLGSCLCCLAIRFWSVKKKIQLFFKEIKFCSFSIFCRSCLEQFSNHYREQSNQRSICCCFFDCISPFSNDNASPSIDFCYFFLLYIIAILSLKAFCLVFNLTECKSTHS